ncbi:MAG: DUF192 domain-containing protein [Proteobacteria bacterium]|nr:DUF192 domain-containing protein [Pseudomonadota bacterium]
MNRKVVRVRVARSLWGRARGLILRPPLPCSVALHLTPCWCIHTGFMRGSLDLVFLDEGHTVLRIVEALKPWRIAGHARARSVLEFNAGEAHRQGLRCGDRLALVCDGEFRHAAA